MRNFVKTNSKYHRITLCILLVSLIVTNIAGQVRRKIEIAKVIQPTSSGARSYFPRQFRFGGGVVPRGSAEFFNPTGERIGASQLRFVVLDKAKLSNNRTDYGAIGIRWNGDVYQLSVPDDLIYPMMRFIERGSYIAYTIPVAGYNKAYFKRNALVEGGGGYVAKEFEDIADFLGDVDLDFEVEQLREDLKAKIMRDVNTTRNGTLKKAYDMGSYVNADFHVKYQVYLEAKGKKVVDVGGLPLRYYWNIARDGSAVLDDVEVFRFPEEQFDTHDRAVLFFQTAAILRQLRQDNIVEFNRFLKEVESLVKTS